jgi:cytochrome c
MARTVAGGEGAWPVPPPLTQGLILAACVATLAAAPASADTGRELYEAQCASCHTLNGGSTPAGPTLKGVMWRKIADRPDFKFSAGLKAQVGRWSPQRLDAYLKDTQAFAPGTDMFWVIADDAERKAIVRFLESQ